MQIVQVSEVMKAARKGPANANIAMQCFQQLHALLGEADSCDCDTVAEMSAMLTLNQAATTASTSNGMLWRHQACTLKVVCLWEQRLPL